MENEQLAYEPLIIHCLCLFLARVLGTARTVSDITAMFYSLTLSLYVLSLIMKQIFLAHYSSSFLKYVVISHAALLFRNLVGFPLSACLQLM